MSKTQTTVTEHGEVQYDTVDCQMCGNEVPEDEAVGVAMDARISVRSLSGLEVKSGHRSNLCNFCSESIFERSGRHGAVSATPWQVLVERVVRMDDIMFTLFFALGAGFLGALSGLFAFSIIVEIVTFLVGVLPL